MRVCLIEICVKTHYVLLDSLIMTYCVDKKNEVFVYTTKEIYNLLNDEIKKNLKFIQFDEKYIDSFFDSIIESKYDVIHINTVSKYYSKFYDLVEKSENKIYFHFHNIDYWYFSFFKYFFLKISNFKNSINFNTFKFYLKDIYFQLIRKRLIKLLNKKSNVKYCLLSETQRILLNKYHNFNDAIIFPTLIFNKNEFKDLSINNNKLRICLPGVLSNINKDYINFIKEIEFNIDFYKKNIIVDLLGKLDKEKDVFYERVINLKNSGLDILYYEEFIDSKTFDTNLLCSDLIVSNVKIQNSKNQLKETAAVYILIKTSKPGIFPINFNLDKEFVDSTLIYNDFSHLTNILKELVKEKAFDLSNKYTPEILINKL